MTPEKKAALIAAGRARIFLFLCALPAPADDVIARMRRILRESRATRTGFP